MSPSSLKARLTSLAVTAFVTMVAIPAGADLPPPEGKKFVSNAFSVTNLAAFSDYTLLAFPWSLSNGRPTEEMAELVDGKEVGLGRRSATPKIYAISRSDYQRWQANYKAPEDNSEDKAARELFASDKVILCDVTLAPTYQVDKTDPRDTVVEAFSVVKIAPGVCDLEKVNAPKVAPPPTTAAPSDDVTSGGANEPTTAPREGGCAGCSVGGTGNGLEGLFGVGFALALTRALFMRRRPE